MNLSITVNNPSGLPVYYTWYRDGYPIVGASGPSYSAQVSSADDGATFYVEASKIGATPLASRTTTLTVAPDVTRPRVLGASSSYANLSTIIIRFSEMVIETMAEDSFNYNFPNTISSLSLGPDGMTVTMVVEPPLVLNNIYDLQVIGIWDLANHVIDPDPTTITFKAGADLPELSIERYDTAAYISWPAPSTGFLLQQADVFLSPSSATAWSTYPTAPSVVNGRNVVTVPINTGKKFFRLRQ